MIKYMIAFMLICGVCWAHEPTIHSIEIIDDIQENRLKNIEDTQEKIFSMMCDLEEKFMGIDRMKQIAMPAIHERKLAAKMKREPNWDGKGKL